MLKRLLTIFAVAAFTCSYASADTTTLWHSDNEEEQSTENWRRVYELTPETAAENGITAGDYLVVTISYINPEGGWPQVAVFDAQVGWPPLANEGVGGKQTPYEVKFPVTNDIYTAMSTNGLTFSGGDIRISDVGFEKGVEVGPFTVWFGNKECGWGNGVSLPAALFADVEANGQLIFWTSDQSFQVLLGAWSGLNLPAYAAGSIDNMTYEDGITTVTLIEEYATANEYDQNGEMKELDVFALMKENGVIMHGTTTVTRIDYIPGAPVNAYHNDIAAMNELATAFEELNNMIDEELPGYAVLKAEEIGALSKGIADLNEQITAAWEAFAETGVYDGPATGVIAGLNEQLIALSAGLTETITEIQEAYAADEEAVNELANAMQEFNTQVAETFPGYAVLKAEEIAALTATIEELNAKIGKAMEAAWETGVYEGLSGSEVSAANEALMALVAGLEETTLAIQEAYEADVAAVNELANAMQEFNTQVAETFPGYAVLKADDIAALTATIEELNNKMTSALEAAFETGVYEGLSGAEVSAANEALIALVAGLEETTLAIQEAYDADEAAVNELANAMQEFNNQVAEEFPGYAVLKADDIAALTATIEELNNKMTSALEAAFETGVYEGLSGAEVSAANEALIALVAGMEETILAIQEAYAADEAAVNELANAMQEFNTSVAETFPGYAVVKAEEIAALTAAIEELNNKLTAAMEAAYETGVYEGLSGAEVSAANEAFLALMAGVEELTANVQAAYDADIAAINELANAMQEFNNQIEEEFPAYANLKAEEIAALTATIEALNQKVTDAWEAVYETGVYEGLSGSDIAPANEALINLVAGMQEALNTINEDYENAVALVNEYTLNVQDLYNQIDDEFPAYWNDHEAELIALNQKAVALSQACETALGEALQTTGEYVTPSEIRTANAELLAIIEAYNEAYAAIENAAMADAEKLAEYAAIVMPYTEDYEAANWDAACELYQYLANTFELVGAAQAEALNETGVYVSPLTDEVLAYIEAGIDALKPVDGINGIANDNNDVRYFDLNGQAVKEPVAGKVYIRVANGKSSKVLVK